MAGEGAGCRVLVAGPDPPPPRLGPCESLWLPLLRTVPVRGSSRLALACLGSVDAVAFTSPRAPRLLALDAREAGVEGELRAALASRDVWAVGPSTAASVQRHLGVPAATPREYTGATLAAELARRAYRSVAGLRSPQGVRDLPEALARAGVAYCEVHVYTTTIDEEALGRVGSLRVDYVAATSPAIARALVSAGVEAPIIAIGPTTAGALRSAGVEPACVAAPHTLQGIASCLSLLREREGRKLAG